MIAPFLILLGFFGGAVVGSYSVPKCDKQVTTHCYHEKVSVQGN